MFLFIICLAIRKGSDINCVKLWTFFCKFYVLSTKFNYAAPFSLFHRPSVSSFDPLATFLLVFFVCLWLFNISSICPRDVFDSVKCKARFLFFDCLSLLLIDANQCFVVFLIVEVFTLIIVMTSAIACILMFFRLVAFSCLYPS